MEHKENSALCRGCGGIISSDEKIVCITEGILTDEDIDSYEETDIWGYMHLGCFLMAVGDPKAILHVRPTNAA